MGLSMGFYSSPQWGQPLHQGSRPASDLLLGMSQCLTLTVSFLCTIRCSKGSVCVLIHSDFKISLSGWHWALELTVSATLLMLYSPWKEVKLGALSPRTASFSEVRSVPSGCAISLATAPVTMGGGGGSRKKKVWDWGPGLESHLSCRSAM